MDENQAFFLSIGAAVTLIIMVWFIFAARRQHRKYRESLKAIEREFADKVAEMMARGRKDD